RVAANHGIQAKPADLATAFQSVWRKTPSAFSADSSVRDPNEKSWWRRLVQSVFEEAGASLPGKEGFDHFFEDLYDHFETPGTWVAIPEALEVVPLLAERFPCIVLSNFDARLRRILRDLDLFEPFDSILLSCELGASKPDPAVFEAAREHFKLPAAEILHIGDDPTCDWKGATDAGFASFRVGEGESCLNQLFEQLSLASS
ncbi:MAG: HAD-IA family hydrolase, partial [Verrucomicrobiota bacterium]